MTPVELLSDLQRRGIHVWADGEDLRFKAEPGAMTAELRSLLVSRKAQMLDFLREVATAAVRPDEPPLGAVDRGGELPLSFAQERLWFIDQWDPDATAYSIFDAVRLDGELAPASLAAALGAVVARHEILRTRFVAEAGEARQRIEAAAPGRLPALDLSGLDGEERRQEELRQLAQAEIRRPFDLRQGPLLRVLLVRLGDRHQVLLLNLHHIVADGWSTGILIEELAALYQAHRRGLPNPLPPLALQYADFAAWQRRWLTEKVRQQQLDYWRRVLAGVPDHLDLPTDHRRPAVRSTRGAVHRFALGSELGAAVGRLARQAEVTPFVVLLAAYLCLLYRWSGQADLVVGCPVAGRDRQALEGLIGCFVNTLVLRGDLSGAPPFRRLLGRLQAVHLGAQAHRELPFEKLVEALNPPRDPGRTPIFQVMFVFQNTAAGEAELEDLALARLPLEGATAKFDLTLTVEGNPALEAELEYSTDLFAAETVARFAAQLSTLLAAATAQPATPCDALPLLGPAEERQVLALGAPATLAPEGSAPFQVPAEPVAASLHEAFEAQVRQTPGAVAVVGDGLRWTYEDLNAQANHLARHLIDQGVGPETRVALLMERTPHLVTAILAILKAGGAYVPLDGAHPPERLAFLLGDSGAQLAVVSAELLEVLPPGTVPILWPQRLGEAAAGPAAPNPPSAADDRHLAYVIYTSGSTGKPKGVLVSHHNVLRLFRTLEETGDFVAGPDDVWTLFHSHAFDFSVWEIWGALLHGGRLVVVPYGVSRDPAAFYELLESQGVTVLSQTPSAFRQLQRVATAEEGIRRLALRAVIFGGEALAFDTLGPWFAAHGDERPRLFNLYGITETTVHVTFRRVRSADAAAWAGSLVGRPLGDLATYLLDHRLRPVPAGVAGEICVAGAGLARGYLGRPALTARRFVPDPFGGVPGERLYRSGDLARWRPGRDLEYLGRIDQQVQIRGFRVELGEIEAALLEASSLAEVAVLALPGDGQDGHRLVAYAVPGAVAAAVGPPSVSELRAALATRLPEYMIPGSFVFLEALPLTPNGKLDRRALPEPDGERPQLAARYVAPRTAAEEVLAQLWAEVLAVDAVGVHDDFFDLGGHSLLATRLVARASDAFALHVPLQALFENRTVATLAAALAAEGERGGVGLPPLERQPRDAPLPLSFAQERLWLFEQLRPGTATYNTYRAGRVRGPLHAAALAGTFNDLVQRHEALRTRYGLDQGEPRQWLEPHRPQPMPVVDLGRLPEAKREAEAERLAQADARRPTDLARAPLARAALLRLGGEDHVFVLTIHHIAYDLGSGGVLLGDLEAIYRGRVEGRPADLPPLTVQYADFAVWQRRWLDGPRREQELAYWRRRLAGLEHATLELPADRPRPAVESPRGDSVDALIPPPEVAAMARLARRQGATSFMAALAVFKVFLHRYTGSEDLVVGSFITNRNRVELEGVVGYFDNTVVLRTDASGGPGFQDFLARVRETALGAYTHQNLPFETVVEAVQPQRGASRAPLFQAAFILELNHPAMEREIAGLRVVPYNLHSATAKFDFALGWREAPEGLAGELEFNTDIFDRVTVERMLAHHHNLWQAVLADPQRPVAELPLLAAAESRQLVEEWGLGPALEPALESDWQPTRQPVTATVLERMEAQMAIRGDAPAVIFEGQETSYRQIDRRSRALAARLRGLGVGPEVAVALFLERSPEAVVAVVGILRAGGAYLPLDPAYPADRLAFMLEDSGAPVVVTTAALADRLPASAARTVILDGDGSGEVWEPEEAGASVPSRALGPPLHSENLVYQIYTSGSTGKPKGVMTSHGALLNLARAFQQACALEPGDRFFMVPSLSFDASAGNLFPVLISGAALVLHAAPADLSPAELRTFCETHRVTLMDIPAAYWSHWVEGLTTRGDRDILPHLSRIIVGGEAIYRDRLEEWAELTGRRVSLLGPYGPTETTVCSVFYTTVDGAELPAAVRKLPIGRPLARTSVYLVGRGLRLVPPGAPGRVLLGGAGVARGYLARPGETARRFLPDPFGAEAGARLYDTGDEARFDRDGILEFLGRADAQVKIRGFRIELAEVEGALTAHPQVAAGVATVRGDRPGEKRLVAYLIPKPGEVPSPAELRTYLEERLPSHMVPSAFFTVEDLPRLPNGKIHRRALPTLEVGPALRSAVFVAPRTDLERRVVEVWKEVLAVESVGLDDNFFDLGGHSLLLVRAHGALRQSLGVELPLVELFNNPSVRRLVEFLEQNPDGEASSAQRPARDEELAAGKDRQRQMMERRRRGRG